MTRDARHHSFASRFATQVFLSVAIFSFVLSPVARTEQGLVLRSRAHCSDRSTAAAVVAAHAVVARNEAEVPRAVRVARVERTRPVVADVACVVELTAPAVAGSGQEETVAVGGREESSVHAVSCRPYIGGVMVQLLPLHSRGHAPAAAPVGCGSIIIRLEDSQVVGETVEAVTGIVAILGELVIIAVAVTVGAPVVGGLGLRLTPSKIVTVPLGRVSPDIAGGPQGTARQAEVNIGYFFHFFLDLINSYLFVFRKTEPPHPMDDEQVDEARPICNPTRQPSIEKAKTAVTSRFNLVFFIYLKLYSLGQR